MITGSIEYDSERQEIVVWVEGNMWRKKADGLGEAGVDLASQTAVAEFTRKAAPGGAGLEALGYERARAVLG